MNIQNAKTRKAAAPALTTLCAIVCAAVFTGCLTMPEANGNGDLAQVAVEILPGRVSPTRDLRLKEMTVTLASSAGDTLRDTITDAGSILSRFPVRLNSPDGSRSITPVYALDPAQEWTLSVKTLDARDSVVHSGTMRAGALVAGALRNVRMPLAARFAAYEAMFSLPPELVAQGARLHRVEVSVDGATACAVEANGSDSVKLACDDLPVGVRALTLSVYGQAAGSAATRLLFKGAADVDISADDVPTASMELNPVDESLGRVGMSVHLGRVGRVTVNVVIPEAVGV